MRDVLIVLFDTSLAKILNEKAAVLGKTYLLVFRPQNLTIWTALVGFVGLNNMIFVDLTSKQLLMLSKAVRQMN